MRNWFPYETPNCGQHKFIHENKIGMSGTHLATDASGNVYTTGFFRDTIDFDPGISIYSLGSNGSTDIFIQKLDSNGNFIWSN